MFWNLVTEHAQKAAQRELGELYPDKFGRRRIPAGSVFVPSDIEMKDGKLHWSIKDARYKYVRPSMLDDFINLHNEDDDSTILRFARKWGVLGVCQHGFPCSHNQYALGLSDDVRPCLPVLVAPSAPNADLRFCESITVWRSLSAKAGALKNIAAYHQKGECGRSEDWAIVRDLQDTGLGETEYTACPQNIKVGRKELALELDRWISMGQVRPQMVWKGSNWQFFLDAVSTGPNLFGFLALNLMSQICAPGTALAVCSSCANAYVPERRPNPLRRNYCPPCRGKSGKQAARRDAARDFRNRQREERRR